MSSEMTLREDKKRKTRQEILANAIALFRKQGIRETRTAEIAQLSGVSSGTLFNYFATKDALVEAWLRGELDATLDEAATSLGERGLRPMLRAACRGIAADFLEPRALRLEGWRLLGRGRSEEFRLGSSTKLVHVVGSEQERERVRQDLSSTALAEMLVEGLEGGIVAAIEEPRSESASRNGARGLEARVELILDGMRKRNERVAPTTKHRSATDAQK